MFYKPEFSVEFLVELTLFTVFALLFSGSAVFL